MPFSLAGLFGPGPAFTNGNGSKGPIGGTVLGRKRGHLLVQTQDGRILLVKTATRRRRYGPRRSSSDRRHDQLLELALIKAIGGA